MRSGSAPQSPAGLSLPVAVGASPRGLRLSRRRGLSLPVRSGFTPGVCASIAGGARTRPSCRGLRLRLGRRRGLSLPVWSGFALRAAPQLPAGLELARPAGACACASAAGGLELDRPVGLRYPVRSGPACVAVEPVPEPGCGRAWFGPARPGGPVPNRVGPVPYGLVPSTEPGSARSPWAFGRLPGLPVAGANPKPAVPAGAAPVLPAVAHACAGWRQFSLAGVRGAGAVKGPAHAARRKGPGTPRGARCGSGARPGAEVAPWARGPGEGSVRTSRSRSRAPFRPSPASTPPVTAAATIPAPPGPVTRPGR
ncbi:hypothetical protein RKD22_000392 [Streptomyces pristinaespiralis]